MSMFFNFLSGSQVTASAGASGTEDEYDGAISGFTYASKSKDVSANIGNLRAIATNFDGTSFYAVGPTNDAVHQYDASTGWDVSTCGTTQGNLSTASEMTSPQGMDFSKDGTKLYVINNTGNVYQYSGTAWDIGSFSYDSKTFNPLEASGSVEGVQVSFDGTKLWILVAATLDTIYQYTMSTAWDVSTASYDSKSFGVVSQDTLMNDFAMFTDGTGFITVGNSTDEVYQYSMSTANDISTASYDSVSFDISSEEGVPRALALGNGSSGTALKVYVGGANEFIYQYE